MDKYTGKLNSNWYVLYVPVGKEALTAVRLERAMKKELLSKAFVPTYEHPMKKQGVWGSVQRTLYPGYVFLESEDVKALRESMMNNHLMRSFLGKEGDDILSITADEKRSLQTFLGTEDKVEMSQGYKEGDTIIITSGPLAGKESMIAKLDRHNRIARLKMSLAGKSVTMDIGLELLSKKEELV